MTLPAEVGSCWQRCASLRVAQVHELSAAAPWWNGMGVHRHRVPTLIIAVGGAARVETGARGRIDLGAGEAVLIRPWIWHSHPVLTGGMALVLGWSHRHGDATVFWPGGGWEGAVPRKLVADGVSAIAAAAPALRPRLCGALVAALARARPASNPMPPAAQAMAHYLWHHRGRAITAAALLRSSGLGQTAANRLFRHWFGSTPKQHLLAIHLELAQHLLLAGRPPGRIWAECGFSSRADLTRRMRLATGLSPRRWAAAGRTPALEA